MKEVVSMAHNYMGRLKKLAHVTVANDVFVYAYRIDGNSGFDVSICERYIEVQPVGSTCSSPTITTFVEKVSDMTNQCTVRRKPNNYYQVRIARLKK